MHRDLKMSLSHIITKKTDYLATIDYVLAALPRPASLISTDSLPPDIVGIPHPSLFGAHPPGKHTVPEERAPSF